MTYSYMITYSIQLCTDAVAVWLWDRLSSYSCSLLSRLAGERCIQASRAIYVLYIGSLGRQRAGTRMARPAGRAVARGVVNGNTPLVSRSPAIRFTETTRRVRPPPTSWPAAVEAVMVDKVVVPTIGEWLQVLWNSSRPQQ